MTPQRRKLPDNTVLAPASETTHFGICARLLLSLALGVVAGCVATPSQSVRVGHNPVLDRSGGVLLLIDACVQKDALGTEGDYFVIEESEAGGRAAAAALHHYIDGTGVTIRGEIITVCAARLNTNSQTIRAAEQVGGRVRDAVPPLKIPASIEGDAEYVSALQLISTYSFERAAVPTAKKGNVQTNQEPTRISMAEFHQAAKVLKDRTGASSVLFLGVLGKSRTGGKALAQFLGAMTIGVGTAYATAGLGTGFYVMFVPGSQVSGSMLEGALIDLDSGELPWSKAVVSIGNPVKPKTLANPEALDMLFRDVMFKSAFVTPHVIPSK